ncbi:TetR/AcrR family transcriptional regulator, partial [Streptomyces sp. NPDC047009]|uniref:TetR/AcrR family transcriptional regulator n=1 Tax=Streptomyces sp. NPDC047009 TaxID=3154496 RepID=UPI0034036EDA
MPGTSGTRRTPRGLETRSRIVGSAAKLFYVKGVNTTTLDDVRLASGTSKSQLYNHFEDKLALIHAVIDVQSKFVLAREEQRLRGVKTLTGLRRWRDALVQANSLQDGSYGCALGAMSIELSDNDEQSRQALNASFDAWRRMLVETLTRLRVLGVLARGAGPPPRGSGGGGGPQGGLLGGT